MLTALRKQTGSWVAKVILLLLVLSFAIWGIGDIFYGNPEEATIASVGDTEISSGELNYAFNRNLDNLQRQFGGQFTREQAIGIGLLQQTLDEQLGQRLLDVEARDMGITVDDETLRRLITENPSFQSAGRFDRLRFNQLIRTTGLSEEGYLEALRQELSRNALTGSVAAAAAVPDVLAETIYRFRNEERRGRFFRIADAEITDLETPGDDALEAVYEEDEQRFTAPEYRKITYVTLEPKDLLEEVEIAEDLIQEAYDDRSARYITPETRSVEQLLANDEEIAAKAEALIEEGKTFAEVAEDLKDDGVSLTDLGSVTEAGMPAGIGQDAFSVNEGEVTSPIQSPFGFHLFKVNTVEPEKVTPLEEVRDELYEELALVEAEDRLPELATQLDDELAAGSSVGEAVEAIGLAAKTVNAVDRRGLDQQGEPVEELAAWSNLIQTAFDGEEGEPSLLEESDDGAYYVVQVDEIIPERLKDIDEVRDEVVEVWEGQQRRMGAKARAEELLTKLQEAASLDTLAANDSITIEEIEPIKRSDTGAEYNLNRTAIDALFETDAGSVAAQVIEVEDGVVVLAVEEVIEKHPSDDQDGFDQLNDELQRQMRADLLAQFGSGLRNKHSIEIDDEALTRLIEYDPSQGYGGGGYPQHQPMF
ncbi:MAG: SurA N-terminal domain-containing protein [Geminicoccales bacterium]